MFIATLETSNFSFSAYGENEYQAEIALVEGFHQHAKQYGISHNWWHELACDIYTREILINRAYRDRELIKNF
jgi:hypothetical protein